MNRYRSLNRGFVGILMLLIGVSIMVFLIVKEITSLQKVVTTNSTDTAGKNYVDITAAENAKNLIEQDNAGAMEELK